MIELKKEICKGCLSARNFGTCFFIEYDIEDKCPCTECLIKVMCRESCAKRFKIKEKIRS